MLLKQGFKHLWLPYTQMQTAKLPLAVKKTKGCQIILEDGTKLIDGISSWWSVCHGYNHPHILKTMQRQLKTMPHVMFAGLANKPAYNLAERLVKFVNRTDETKNKKLTRVFYSDSGSTAVEVALKMAVQYFLNQGDAKKCKIMSFQNGYHGDTMGGMSLADPKAGMHAKFKNYLPRQLVTKIPKTKQEFASFEKFLLQNQDIAAALIIEPLIQCAGGMIEHSAAQLEKIVKLTKKYNILVIFDECATGFYRLGTKFAYHQTKITPDILCLGKALTGGTVTLAVTMANDKIYNAFLDESLDKALMHGPTFMGNALACSAANASLDLFEKTDYEAKTQNIAEIFIHELTPFASLEQVTEIRIKGALAVIELKNANWDYIFKLREELIKHGVWLRPFGKIIYFMPPLIISNKEIKSLVTALKNCIMKKDL